VLRVFIRLAMAISWLALSPTFLIAQERYGQDAPSYETPRDRVGALPGGRLPLRTPAETLESRDPRGAAVHPEIRPEPAFEQPAPARPRELPEEIPPADDRAIVPESGLPGGLDRFIAPESLTSSLQTMALVSVLSLAPALLLMTTCFVRITIVLGLLRQALGTPQLPPTQVLTSIAMFLTFLVMAPVWQASYEQGVKPYVEHRIGLDEAWQRGIQPIRQFMILQIERTGNAEDVWLFLEYSGEAEPSTYADVPLTALAPAFLLSELKTAFLIGFQIYLPFVVLDMVVSSVMVSMGMVMVPPTTVSFPLKLLLFVLVDGWRLVVGMLLESFVPFS